MGILDLFGIGAKKESKTVERPVLFVKDIVGGVNDRFEALPNHSVGSSSPSYKAVFNKEASRCVSVTVKCPLEQDTLDVSKSFSSIVLVNKNDLGLLHPVVGVVGCENSGKTVVSNGLVNVRDDFDVEMGSIDPFASEGNRKLASSLGNSDALGAVIWADMIHMEHDWISRKNASSSILMRHFKKQAGITIREHAQVIPEEEMPIYKDGCDVIVFVNKSKVDNDRYLTFVVHEDSPLASKMLEFEADIKSKYPAGFKSEVQVQSLG